MISSTLLKILAGTSIFLSKEKKDQIIYDRGAFQEDYIQNDQGVFCNVKD